MLGVMVGCIRSRCILFAPYTTSYKNFKERYFKTFVEPDGRPYFYDSKGKTKFPFQWIQNLTKITTWPRSSRTPWDKEALFVFYQLPYKLPTRELVALYGSSRKWANFTGM